ncbi:hypothetical protein AB0L71_12210 [Streptomyces sp. NPDC052052]|uniref:hypothetical protein n=1 Tax=Streptomyces sp. NPDC052052 TaxID=3154756 RepID=UPI00344A6007
MPQTYMFTRTGGPEVEGLVEQDMPVLTDPAHLVSAGGRPLAVELGGAATAIEAGA